MPWITPPTERKAFTWPSTEPYDAAIIDIMLPKLDGLALIERLRKEKVNTPGHHPERQGLCG